MSKNGHIKPQAYPPLNIPQSSTSVEVSIINTSTNIVCPANGFVKPVLKGHEAINMPTCSFHIRHPSGKEVLFDLGCRKDWWNLSPPVVNTIKEKILGLDVAKGVDEVLKEGGADLNRISSIIISHWHWDHSGDPSRFPKSAELVFGPGFRELFMPGYPTNPKGVMLDSDFEGRTVREAEFSSEFKIGEFEAHDFFGDGSFYILNVPGHAVGHVSALARTTKDTFVFMGGDICHFGGSYRPTIYAPMPETIPADVPLDRNRFRLPCPCSIFTACHPDPPNARTQPYYSVTLEEGSWYIDPLAAQTSLNRLQAFDADPNVFVCIAHDEGLRDVVDWFPNGTITDWKKKGWKEKSQWGFLNALPIDGKPAAELLAPGLMKSGKVAKL